MRYFEKNETLVKKINELSKKQYKLIFGYHCGRAYLVDLDNPKDNTKAFNYYGDPMNAKDMNKFLKAFLSNLQGECCR